MTNNLFPFLTLALLVTYSSQPSTVFAQGPLTPPGTPAPLFKTLDQVEPRADVLKLSGDSGNLHIISQPGSYYLTTSVVKTSGDANGILIATNEVTLDLNGFGVLGSPGDGAGIIITGPCTNIIVRNGNIKGWFAGVRSLSAASQNVVFERLNVGGDADGGGIVLVGNGAVRDCTVGKTGGGRNGIFCADRAVVSNCTVRESGNTGIYVRTNCVVTGCYVEKTSFSGIYVDSPGGSEIVGNTCTDNNKLAGGGNASIFINSAANRIDGNRVIGGSVAGISVFSSSAYSNNVIVRNFVSGLGLNSYVMPGSQIVGPVIDTTGSITNANPWANFSF